MCRVGQLENCKVFKIRLELYRIRKHFEIELNSKLELHLKSSLVHIQSEFILISLGMANICAPKLAGFSQFCSIFRKTKNLLHWNRN